MHPAPIKVTAEDVPANARFFRTLESGERIYIAPDGTIYAAQRARGSI